MSSMKEIDDWDPKLTDFNDPGLSTFRKGPARNYSRSGESTGKEATALYLKNIPLSFKEDSLRALLSKYGKVESVYLGKPNEKSFAMQSVYAIVKVDGMRDVTKIIENVHKKPPLNLSVELALTSEEKQRRKANASHMNGLQAPDCNGVTSAVNPVPPGSNSPKISYPHGTGRGMPLIKLAQLQGLKSERSQAETGVGRTMESSSEEAVKIDAIGEPATDLPVLSHPTKSRVISNGPVLPRAVNCVRCNFFGSKRCSICKAWYCSKTCQIDDWYYHKEKCSPPPPLEDGVVLTWDNVDPLRLSGRDDLLEDLCSEDRRTIHASPPPPRVPTTASCDVPDRAETAGEKAYSFFKKFHKELRRPHSSMLTKNCEVEARESVEGVNAEPVSDVKEKVGTPVEVVGVHGLAEGIVEPELNLGVEHVPVQVRNDIPVPEINPILPSPAMKNDISVSSPRDAHRQAMSMNSIGNGFVPKVGAGIIDSAAIKNPSAHYLPPSTDIVPATIGNITKDQIDPLGNESTSHASSVTNGLSSHETSAKAEEADQSPFNITTDLKLNCVYEGVITVCDSMRSFNLMIFNEFAQKILSVPPEELCSGEPLSPSQVKCKDLVVARSPSDESWYRASIHAVLSSQAVEVVYIDFGNKETVSSLRAIPSSLKTLFIPGLALAAALHKEVSAEKLSRLSETLIKCDSKIKFKVLGKKSKSVKVAILDEEKNMEELGNFIMSTSLHAGTDTPKTMTQAAEEPSPAIVSLPLPSPAPVKKIFRKDLKSIEVGVDREYTSIPTWFSEGLVHVQLVSEENRNLMQELTFALKECGSKDCARMEVSKGEMVCALLPEDETWYRGEVKAVSEAKLFVHFVDFGNSDWVPLVAIRRFSASLSSTPVMCLAIEPVTSLPRSEVEGRVKALIQQCSPMSMKVASLDPLQAVFKDISDPVNGSTPVNSVPNGEPVVESPKSPKQVEEKAVPKCDAMTLFETGAVKPLFTMYDECKTTSLPVADNVEVVILQPTNPLNIFLTPKADVGLFEQLDKVSTQMNEFCNSLQTPYYQPREGEVCLAKFSADGLWYRAACILVERDAAVVIFVDYGNHDRVPFTSLVQMVDRFMELPVIAVHCRLKDVTNEDVERGGPQMQKKLESLLPPFSPHNVNVVDKCKETFVYEIQIPSVSIQHLME